MTIDVDYFLNDGILEEARGTEYQFSDKAEFTMFVAKLLAKWNKFRNGIGKKYFIPTKDEPKVSGEVLFVDPSRPTSDKTYGNIAGATKPVNPILVRLEWNTDTDSTKLLTLDMFDRFIDDVIHDKSFPFSLTIRSHNIIKHESIPHGGADTYEVVAVKKKPIVEKRQVAESSNMPKVGAFTRADLDALLFPVGGASRGDSIKGKATFKNEKGKVTTLDVVFLMQLVPPATMKTIYKKAKMELTDAEIKLRKGLYFELDGKKVYVSYLPPKFTNHLIFSEGTKYSMQGKGKLVGINALTSVKF